MPMMKVGSVTFGMDGPAYEDFVKKISVDWATGMRIGRRPAKQTTGIGDETITLTGTIYGLFNNLGIGQIKKIEDLLLDQKPHLVIEGTGRKYGYFVIESLEEKGSRHIDTGAPQKQEFTLTMSAYGEDMLSPDAGTDGADGTMDLGGRNANMA